MNQIQSRGLKQRLKKKLDKAYGVVEEEKVLTNQNQDQPKWEVKNKKEQNQEPEIKPKKIKKPTPEYIKEEEEVNYQISTKD
jgi:hypothetical protein